MPYSEAGYRASQKYRASNIKRVPLDMQIADYEKLKAHAETKSESVNGFIKRAIQETIERETGAAGDPQETHRRPGRESYANPKSKPTCRE